jgi:hypothetical protein
MTEQQELGDLPPVVQRELLSLHRTLTGLSQADAAHVYWTLRLIRPTYTAENAMFVDINDSLGRLAVAEWFAALGNVDFDLDQALDMWHADIAATMARGGDDG